MANKTKRKNTIVGTRIRELRTARDETQKDLANALFKSESTVRMWELGRSEPDIETLKQIAERYTVPVAYIVGDTNFNLNLQLFSSDMGTNNNIIIRSRDGSTLESELNDDQLEIVKRMIEQFDQKEK